jgi:hypothetical protein
MEQTEYRVAYVDFHGRISSEGVEFIRRSGEHRTGFVMRYLNALRREGWALSGIHPLRRSESSYFIMQRPFEADADDSDAPASEQSEG